MMGCEFRHHTDVIKYIRAQVQTGKTQGSTVLREFSVNPQKLL